MPDYKYAEEKFSPSVSFETDNSFGDVEIFGTLMTFKEMKKSYWTSLGIGGSVAGKIICSEGIAYFGACDKNFYAVDIETGKEIWRFSCEGPVTSACCISGDILCFGSYDQKVYALNKHNGELLWSLKTKSKIIQEPTACDGVIYLGTVDSGLYAISAINGKIIWRFSVIGRIDTPVIEGDKIFVGFNNFYCLSKEGRLIWRFKNSIELCTWIIAHEKDAIYFGSYDSNFYCLETSNGNVKWTYKTKDAAYPGVINGNKICFGSRDCNLYCVNKNNGSFIWSFKTGGFAMVPIVHMGILCFGSYDNNVYALNPETGSKIWSFKTDGFVTFVSAYEGKLFFGSWDCHAYCLDIKTGKLIWKFNTSMSAPSKLEAPEATQTKTLEVRWSNDEETKNGTADKGGSFSDYGEFSGTYISKDKNDYISSRKKGYIK